MFTSSRRLADCSTSSWDIPTGETAASPRVRVLRKGAFLRPPSRSEPFLAKGSAFLASLLIGRVDLEIRVSPRTESSDSSVLGLSRADPRKLSSEKVCFRLFFPNGFPTFSSSPWKFSFTNSVLMLLALLVGSPGTMVLPLPTRVVHFLYSGESRGADSSHPAVSSRGTFLFLEPLEPIASYSVGFS